MRKYVIIVAISALAIAGCDNTSSSSPAAGQPADSVDSSTTVTRSSTPSNPPAASEAPTTAPDNTAINTRDRDPDAPTAGMTGQSSADVQLAANIRKAITKQSDLSINAQNCKVVVLNARVTLRGPVNSQTEKDEIGRLAAAAAGAANVDNELEIAVTPQTNP